MRYQVWILAIAVLVTACGSDNPASPTPTPTPPAPAPLRFNLSGVITDNTTGATLADATVTVTDGPNTGRSGTSDSSGQYNIVDLQSSRFMIRVTRDGYSLTTRSIQLNTNITHDVALDPLLTGTWRGTVALTSNGQRSTNTVSNVQVTQTESQLTASLNLDNGMSGSFNGSLDGGRFSGTLRIEMSTGGSRCVGTSALTGPTTASTMTLFAPFLSLENCTGNVRDIDIRLTR